MTHHSPFGFDNPKTNDNIDIMCQFCKNEDTELVNDNDLDSEGKAYPSYFRKCFCCSAKWVDRIKKKHLTT